MQKNPQITFQILFVDKANFPINEVQNFCKNIIQFSGTITQEATSAFDLVKDFVCCFVIPFKIHFDEDRNFEVYNMFARSLALRTPEQHRCTNSSMKAKLSLTINVTEISDSTYPSWQTDLARTKLPNTAPQAMQPGIRIQTRSSFVVVNITMFALKDP